jgi:ribonuclease D
LTFTAKKRRVAANIARRAAITNHLHQGDLPAGLKFNGDIAVDTEAMGLNNKRDRLCLVQLSDGQGDVHLVQFAPGSYHAPNLCKLLTDPSRVKLFHFARFDVSIMKEYLGILVSPVYCTRTASRLARTYTDKHGYKDICKELLGADISKQQQSSDWGATPLSPEQMEYAASDVLHLHKLREKLDAMLKREGRSELAQGCFNFLPHRALLDLAGWEDQDIFAHS